MNDDEDDYDDEEDDGNDYGDEEGMEDDDGDFGFDDDFGGHGHDDDEGGLAGIESAGDNQDEKAIVAEYQVKYNAGVNIKEGVEITVKGLGKATANKILNTKNSSGDTIFSNAEKEAIQNLFK